MKLKENSRRRLSLTLVFSAIVILIFVSVLLLVSVTLYILVAVGVLSKTSTGDLSNTQLILIYGFASLGLGSLMTLLLSRYPVRPVNNLINIMSRLASGDFSPRINLRKPWSRLSAFRELSDSFNKMADELQNTELLRSDFINNFSHEFKTPIVSITGFAKLLKRENLTEQQAEYVKIIEEESLRLSQMATNVLNLTKIENQSILSDVTVYNLSEQLRSCILLLSSKWEKKEIDFLLDFNEHEICGNEELLKHIWINLIDNAIKFSPQGSTVEITLEEKNGFLEASVTNSGPDISPEQQKNIFNKFYQADESHSTQGNGIGLAIAKKVADLHSGSISVHSGSGKTTFTVLLPKENKG